MLKKIIELSVKKRIILALVVILTITMFVSIAFASFNTNSKTEKNKKLKESETSFNTSNITSEDIVPMEPEEEPMIIIENEEATKEELEKGQVKKINTITQYYIVVNYSTNVVTIYGKDDNNAYTVPIKAMICSTGTATPRSGVYSLPGVKSKWGALFGNVYGQYTTKIVGNILFHSVPYTAKNNGTLEYWEYDKLGTSASMGCIRLTTADAIWIYNNCGKGTQVEFTGNHSDPLGKPTAIKISGSTNLRGFDPTDPAPNNPWRNESISINTIPMGNETEEKKNDNNESDQNTTSTENNNKNDENKNQNNSNNKNENNNNENTDNNENQTNDTENEDNKPDIGNNDPSKNEQPDNDKENDSTSNNENDNTKPNKPVVDDKKEPSTEEKDNNETDKKEENDKKTENKNTQNVDKTE